MQNSEIKSERSEDRRVFADRRKKNLRTFVYSVFFGKRRGPQRTVEKSRPFYKDVYDVRLLALILLIVCLCAADAGLTLLILEKGGVELNPVMIWLLEISSQSFFITKFCITSLGLFFVLVHIRFRVLKTLTMPHFLVALFGFYLFLVGYELSILAA